MKRVKDRYETVAALKEGVEEEFGLFCADESFGNEFRDGSVFHLELTVGAFA